jgi:hypothetical protein
VRLALVLLLVARTAAANPSNADVDRARVYFERGKALYEAHDYKRAVEEYLEAYKIASFPELIFNIGQAYRLSNNDAEALKSYDLFLQQQPTGPLADEARAHVLELRAKAPRDQPKQDVWKDFDNKLVIDKSGEVDMRPAYSLGGRISMIDDGMVYGAHATYIKRLGRYVALAPRAQVGLVTMSYRESTVDPNGFSSSSDATAIGVMAEVQGRVIFPVAPWFFLGTGLSLGYVSAADTEFDSSSSSSHTVGAFTYPLMAEIGFVIEDRYELGIQLTPLGFIDDDFIGNGTQFISVTGSYRMW